MKLSKSSKTFTWHFTYTHLKMTEIENENLDDQRPSPLEDSENTEELDSASDSDEIPPSFNNMLFKLKRGDQIVAFSNDTCYHFDLELHATATQKVDFPYEAASSNAFPALVFGQACFGIFQQQLFRIEENNVSVLKKLRHECNPFYSHHNGKIIY